MPSLFLANSPQGAGDLTLAAVYTPFRSVLNMRHWRIAPPNIHASAAAWLIARGNKFTLTKVFPSKRKVFFKK